MLRGEPDSLDYLQILKEGRQQCAVDLTLLRFALLGDISTQHLASVLCPLFARNGYRAEIYEAPFDTVELEALDRESGLYKHHPDAVVILQSIGKLRALYYGNSADRAGFVRMMADRAVSVWDAIARNTSAAVLQSTYVLPHERPFGNYGLKVDTTLLCAAAELNRELVVRARDRGNVVINDVDFIASWNGRRQFLDERLWIVSKSLCALQSLPLVSQNIVDIVLALQGRSVKCVVLDLDGTLWGGVVGDVGIDGLSLGPPGEGEAFQLFQSFLKELGRRGILLAICSKNDDQVARHAFREHPEMILKEEDIAVFVANWQDKASNIREIVRKLGIGLDAVVFLDDNPFERNLVRALLPEVIVPELPEDPAEFVGYLCERNLFETGSHSSVDADRAAMIRAQAVRDTDKEQYDTVEAFLESLETVATFRRFDQVNLERIVQLFQRTNQFNLTTRRYTKADCLNFMSRSDCFPFYVDIEDRFGKFGIVGVVVLIIEDSCVEIDSFLLSCRVFQRGVEQSMMNKVVQVATEVGADTVMALYVPTAKNQRVQRFLPDFGFTLVGESADGATEWRLGIRGHLPEAIYVSEAPGEALTWSDG